MIIRSKRGHPDVFTTGEVAKICRCSQQAIIRCFDSGKLKGYRIPGSKFRQIPANNLIAFMQANGIPLENLENRNAITVIAMVDDGLAEALRGEMSEATEFSFMHARNAFDTGMQAMALKPDAVIVDCADGTCDAEAIALSFARDSELRGALVFALVREECTSPPERSAGIVTVDRALDAAALAERVRDTVNQRRKPR